MKLSDWVAYAVDAPCTLISDGEFRFPEQCGRIRENQALTFVESRKYIGGLEDNRISCVICTPELLELLPDHIQGRVVTDMPRAAIFRIHNAMQEQVEKKPTVIDPTARISPLAYVAPYDVVIGENVIVGPFAVIEEGVVLERDVRIGANTLLTARGVTNVKLEENRAFLVQNAGPLRVEEGVQVSAGCIIERGLLFGDTTVLGAYTMIAGDVIIGHGSKIGKQVMLTGAVKIAGNCVIGDRAFLGMNAVLSNAITVGDDARISLGAVVTKNVPAGETVSGNFVINHQRFLRNLKESIRED